jgi:hypothetical protein
MCFAWIYYIVQHKYIWASLHIVFEQYKFMDPWATFL